MDVVVIGAGAAGLFAALAARGAIAPDGTPTPPAPDAPSVLLVDGQQQPGRKILISGGGRCNVTNATVEADDFWTSTPRLVRNALRAFGTTQAQAWFDAAGLDLQHEPLGKLFPASGRARDVLGALLDACDRAGVATAFGAPVVEIAPVVEVATGDDRRWTIRCEGEEPVACRRVVLATGGRSVPATGSTGFGLDLATTLGHELVAPVPALAALHGTVGLGTPDDLAGITVPVLTRVVDHDGAERARAAGSLLFTHKGVTGPAALDVSGEVELLLATGASTVRVELDLWSLADPAGPFAEHLDAPKLPGCCLADAPAGHAPAEVDRQLAAAAEAAPRSTVAALLGARLPRRLAELLAGNLADTPAGQLRREDRRALADRLARLPVDATATGGWASAEVTRGGVPLDQLDRVTLESRRAPGLHLCGEVCDVTGRLGGFNFQWAWTSGWLAGRGASAGSAR